MSSEVQGATYPDTWRLATGLPAPAHGRQGATASRPVGLTVLPEQCLAGHLATFGDILVFSVGMPLTTMGGGEDAAKCPSVHRAAPPLNNEPQTSVVPQLAPVQMSLILSGQLLLQPQPPPALQGLDLGSPSLPAPAPVACVQSSSCLWLGCLWAPTTTSGGNSGVLFLSLQLLPSSLCSLHPALQLWDGQLLPVVSSLLALGSPERECRGRWGGQRGGPVSCPVPQPPSSA